MHAIARLALALAAIRSVHATCYFPNGQVSKADTACDSGTTDSACCFTGQACLSNGLCVSDPLNATAARLHRGTCTDQNWNSDACPNHCTSVKDNGVPVYSCNSTSVDSYCCFDDCECNNSQFETFGFQQSPADVYTLTIIGDKSFVQTHTSTASSASSTGASQTVASSSATTTGTPASETASSSPSSTSSSSSSSSSNGTAIGVGVGVGVGGALILGAAAFFFFRRRAQKSSPVHRDAYPPAEADSAEYYPPPQSQKYAYSAASQSPYSPTDPSSPMQSQQNYMSELPATYSAPVELSSDNTPKRIHEV